MDKIWYYKRRGSANEKFGPYSEDELINMIRKGIIDPLDQIWMVDMDDWIVLKDSIYSFYLNH